MQERGGKKQAKGEINKDGMGVIQKTEKQQKVNGKRKTEKESQAE